MLGSFYEGQRIHLSRLQSDSLGCGQEIKGEDVGILSPGRFFGEIQKFVYDLPGFPQLVKGD